MATGWFASLNPGSRVKELSASDGDPDGVGEDKIDNGLFGASMGSLHRHRHNRHRHAHHHIGDDNKRFDDGVVTDADTHNIFKGGGEDTIPTFHSRDTSRLKSNSEDKSYDVSLRLSPEENSNWWFSERTRGPNADSASNDLYDKRDDQELFRSARNVDNPLLTPSDKRDFRVIAKNSVLDTDSTGDKQYDVLPFNTNENSDAAHFDVEFFPEPLDSDSSWDKSITNNTVKSIDNNNNKDDFNFENIPYSSVAWGSSPSNNAPNVHDFQHKITQNSVRTSAKDNYFADNISHRLFNSNNNSSTGDTGSSIINSFFQGGNFTSGLSSDPVQTYHLDLNNLFATNSTTSTVLEPFFANNDTATNLTMSDGDSTAGDIYIWSILLMAPLVVFGVAGNTLVILAISLEKRLQNVTNYFLLSLAVTDLLVSLIVMPFSIINVFTGRWLFGTLVCDFFVTSDVLMCTSSIFHLCTISTERYIGIRYPLWSKNKSKRLVLLKIVLVWTLAFAITSPITVLGVVKEENILVHGQCVLSNDHFIIYGSIFAFYIPLTIMVVMYILTVRMLSKQAKLCSRRRGDDREGEPMIRRSTSSKSWRGRPKYYGREVTNSLRHPDPDEKIMSSGGFHPHYYELTTRSNARPHFKASSRHSTLNHDGGCGGSGGSPIAKRSTINAIPTINNNKSSHGVLSKSSKNGKNNVRRARNGVLFDAITCGGNRSGGIENRANTNSSEYQYCNGHSSDLGNNGNDDGSRQDMLSSSPSHDQKHLKDLVRKHHVALRAANILLMKKVDQGQGQMHLVPTTAATKTTTLLTTTPPSSTKASIRRDNSVKTEQKATKVLGVVFMIFVICWAPFFTVNILVVLCDRCKFESTLFTAFVWLGWASSTLNPIIYTIFNNIFRNTFIKLLCCRYRLLHRARRNSNLMRKENGIMTSSITCSTNTTLINSTNCSNNNSNLSASNKASTSSVMDESNC